jgi:hypothetical protein
VRGLLLFSEKQTAVKINAYLAVQRILTWTRTWTLSGRREYMLLQVSMCTHDICERSELRAAVLQYTQHTSTFTLLQLLQWVIFVVLARKE